MPRWCALRAYIPHKVYRQDTMHSWPQQRPTLFKQVQPSFYGPVLEHSSGPSWVPLCGKCDWQYETNPFVWFSVVSYKYGEFARLEVCACGCKAQRGSGTVGQQEVGRVWTIQLTIVWIAVFQGKKRAGCSHVHRWYYFHEYDLTCSFYVLVITNMQVNGMQYGWGSSNE